MSAYRIKLMNCERMNKNYMIFGTKRCGHHAIIDWLMPQIGDVIRFYNDRKYIFYSFEEDIDEHNLVEHMLELRSKVDLFLTVEP